RGGGAAGGRPPRRPTRGRRPAGPPGKVRPATKPQGSRADGKARKAKAAGDDTGDSVTASGGRRPRGSKAATDAVATGDGGASPETRSRLDVRKTYKLFIGGAFPRSESGRSYPVAGPDGTLLA